MSVFKRVREFLEEEDALADSIEAEYDNIANFLEGGLTSDNIAAKGISAASIADHTITGGQLASGYNVKHTFGSVGCSIPNGSQLGAVGEFAHGLGVTPSHVEFIFSSGANYAIVFEGRLINWDATNVAWQMVASTPVPGEFVDTAYWHAMAIE